jgi:hypothetical protein
MEAHPVRTLGMKARLAGAGAMLVACRLAGLSAREAYYAGVNRGAQSCAQGCQRRAPTPVRRHAQLTLTTQLDHPSWAGAA